MKIEARDFRNALGCFPTGVAVITVKPPNSAAFGMTVNSFASVSLDPPLILWSLDRRSECIAGFEACEAFAVNLLTAEQRDLSVRFARRDTHGVADMATKTAVTGSPILADCHAWLDCRLTARHDGGDHVIMVGEVLALDWTEDVAPLVFYRGAYHELD